MSFASPPGRPVREDRRAARWLLAWIAPVVVGCGMSSSSSTLQAPQTFNFTTQPIVFSPPPKQWLAEGEGSGIRGVRYVKLQSVGEGISIGDFRDLSNRSRRAELATLLAMDPDFASFEYDEAARKAWPRIDAPYSPLETEVAEAVTAALHRADQARRARDYETVREELRAAQTEAERLHFTFEDVIERAIFRPENTTDPSRYKSLVRRETQVAGKPAVVIDCTIDLPEGRRYIRRVYVFHNDHLFVAEFIGLKESLALFDKVVASISFPS